MVQTQITLTGAGIQKSQDFDITISIVANVTIDAITAKRQATNWLVNEVGNMLMAGTPRLEINQNTVWVIPILLTSSMYGTIAEVGTINVDANNGELLITDTSADAILNQVKQVEYPPLPTN